MPACLAHYQFGRDVLPRLGEALRKTVDKYKREFDIGLQGPDIFFYYQPYRRNSVVEYGIARHAAPAYRMFAPILEKMRENAALSYLIGLVCHYALDKVCHPYVFENSRGSCEHQLIEAAFDWDVKTRAGLSEARFRYLPAAGLDFGAMAVLWPGISADTIRKCAATIRRATRLLDRRRFLEALETVLRKHGALTPMTLPVSVTGALSAHVKKLRLMYKEALAECPELIRTALEFMGSGRKLDRGQGFDLNYKGTVVDG